ncbi:MAG TPA: ABATE domain-containing protein [Gemmatimonadota bacterium]|nr:ABATE domain-containing protein [Gemmatimonadota bacterium]
MAEDRLSGLSLIGGRSSLDFVNTEGGQRSTSPDRIQDYGDLARWGAYAGVIGEDEAARLLEHAAADPAEARRVHARAIEFREALFRILDAIGSGETTQETDREILDREVAAALAHQRLVPHDGHFDWEIARDEGLDRILWLLAADAADLLASEQLGRVKKCSGDHCEWVFVDESRNRSRRWCEMSDCGNRAKQRRYQRRHKKAVSQS